MPKRINTQLIGNFGESLACQYLEKSGYHIIEKNWRSGRFEIDLVARHNNCIVFVEVKTRGGEEYGEAESFVTPRKQKNLVTAAHHYLRERDISLEARFDIIAITGDNNSPTVKHLPDAFRAWAR